MSVPPIDPCIDCLPESRKLGIIAAAMSGLPSSDPCIDCLPDSTKMTLIAQGIEGCNPCSDRIVENIAALRAVDVATVSDGTLFTTLGYTSRNDGGQGVYIYNSASAVSDNGGTVIAPTVGSGRYLLVVSDSVDVKQFGAVGDNVADDSIQIQNAASWCLANNKTLTFFPATYYVTQGLTITCPLAAENARIEVPGSFASAVISVNPGSVPYIEDKVFRFPEIRSRRANPPVNGFEPGSVGIRINNIRSSRFYFLEIKNLETGIWIDANGEFTAYNQFHNPTITDCKVAIQLKPTSGGGFVNQNAWLGGRINQTSQYGASVPGFRHVLIDGNGQSRINNNTFYSLSMEGSASEWWVDIIDGELNIFYNPRFEAFASLLVGPSFRFSSPGGTSVIGDTRYCVNNRIVASLLSFGQPTISYVGPGIVQNNTVEDEDARVYSPTAWTRTIANSFSTAAAADASYRWQVQSATGEHNWADGTALGLRFRMLCDAVGSMVLRHDGAVNTRVSISNYATGVSNASTLRLASGAASSANVNFADIYCTDSSYSVGGTRFSGRLVFAPGKIGSNTDNGLAYWLNSVGSTIDYYIGGVDRTARWESDGSLSLEAGWNTVPAALVTLTADNQSVAVSKQSIIRLTSNDTVAANRTFTLANGRSGQRIMLFWTSATNRGELVSGANMVLASTWAPTSVGSNLSLVWDSGTSAWYETGRAL